jgi:MFS family permease
VNRNLVLMSFSLMTWGLGEGMFYFFQPLYLQELGAAPLKIGGILGMVGLAMTLSFLPAGFLSDRIGRRPLIVAAWVIGTLSTGFMALANSIPMFVVGMVLYGTTSFVVVPMNSYTTAARGRWSVGRTITSTSASFSLGYIVGALLGGWLGAQSGLQTNFRIATVILVFSTLIIFFIEPQPVEKSAASGKWEGFRSLLNRSYGQYLVLAFFITLGLYLPQPLAQNFLQNERGINLVQVGQLLSMRSLGIVILNLTLGQANARLGTLLAQGFVAISTLFILYGKGIPFYMAGYFLLGGFMTARGLIIAQACTLFRSSYMGVAYGLLETMTSLAMVLGPPLAGLLYSLHPEWIYSTSFVVIVVGLAANLILSPIKGGDIKSFEESDPL